MDEVRIERLLAKHGKDALLVIIRDWPKSEKYKNEPELVTSLEYLVCMYFRESFFDAGVLLGSVCWFLYHL